MTTVNNLLEWTTNYFVAAAPPCTTSPTPSSTPFSTQTDSTTHRTTPSG